MSPEITTATSTRLIAVERVHRHFRMEFIESQGLRDVFGLDVHFAEAGYRLLPRRSRI